MGNPYFQKRPSPRALKPATSATYLDSFGIIRPVPTRKSSVQDLLCYHFVMEERFPDRYTEDMVHRFISFPKRVRVTITAGDEVFTIVVSEGKCVESVAGQEWMMGKTSQQLKDWLKLKGFTAGRV